MEKERTLFDELIGMCYSSNYVKYDNEVWVKTKIKLREWKDIPYLEGKISAYTDTLENLKEILRIYFRGEVELLLKEVELKHLEEISKHPQSNHSRELNLRIEFLTEILKDNES